MNLSRALRKARGATGMKQRQLAQLAGMNQARLSLLEGDWSPVTVVDQLRLCEALAIEPGLLDFLAMDAAERAELSEHERAGLLRRAGEFLVS